jgi:glutamine amidotransferase
MGWNEVEFIDGMKAHYYFAHSYCAEPADGSVVWGRAHHGETFCAAVKRENLWAVQFHPEKSQRAGLQLLERFLCE